MNYHSPLQKLYLLSENYRQHLQSSPIEAALLISFFIGFGYIIGYFYTFSLILLVLLTLQISIVFFTLSLSKKYVKQVHAGHHTKTQLVIHLLGGFSLALFCGYCFSEICSEWSELVIVNRYSLIPILMLGLIGNRMIWKLLNKHLPHSQKIERYQLLFKSTMIATGAVCCVMSFVAATSITLIHNIISLYLTGFLFIGSAFISIDAYWKILELEY